MSETPRTDAELLSSVGCTSVRQLRDNYMENLKRLNAAHLPEECKSWEEVWNRHCEMVKELTQLRTERDSLKTRIEEIEMIQSFALDKDYYAKFSALRAEHDALAADNARLREAIKNASQLLKSIGQ